MLKTIDRKHVQAPALPIKVLLDEMFTTVFPVIVPLTITMVGVVPVTAEVRASRVVTVMVDPPFPPVVLVEELMKIRSELSVSSTATWY